MASPDLVAPTVDEVTYALARMTPDRLRAVVISYVANVRGSGSSIFDANCLFGRLPQAAYLIKISKRQPHASSSASRGACLMSNQ
jgi:hypothetical protein